MWHKIWDTATSFHQRYIRPVWIRVHYSKLQEVVDDDGEIDEEIYINGEDRSHITAKSQVVRYGSTCKFTSKSSSFPTSLEHEDFDEVDAGFHRPTITLPVLETAQNGDIISNSPTDTAFKGSSSCLNSTVTDLKHAIKFPSKRPPYRLVQEEADRIEIISIDNSSATSSKRRDSDEDYKKSNHLLQHQSNSSQNNVEEILQSSSVVAKKSKSRRKKIKKKLGRSARVSMHFLKEAFILGFTPPAPCLYFTGP